MNNTEFKIGVIKPVECVKEGWELIKNDYWVLFAIALIGALIGGFTMYILFGAMICGIFYAFLQAIDGKPVAFENLWKGFDYFKPGFIVMLVMVVPTIFVYAIMYVPVVVAITMGANLSQGELMTLLIGVAAIDLMIIIILVCFHTLLMFSFPLIVDRNLSAMDAMKTSARAVWENLGGVVGLIAVNFGLMFLGYLALCIGLYFVIPVMIAANAVAYRKVFPVPFDRNFKPPPPQFYQGI